MARGCCHLGWKRPRAEARLSVRLGPLREARARGPVLSVQLLFPFLSPDFSFFNKV